MKKLIATALALTMVLGLSTTALAAGNVDGAGTGPQEPIDVTAKYNDGVTEPAVYSVDLAWEDMTFTYNESGTRTWNPDTHTYTDSTTSGWDKTTATIQMTNHSNVAVDVDLTYTPVEGTGITGALNVTEFSFKAGPEGDPEGASTKFATLTISGTPNDTVTAEGVTVGTITVTIS